MAEGNGAVALAESELMDMAERMAALEMALESQGWRELTGYSDQEFTRQGLRDITEFSRVMALKNPLIKRAITLKRLYVFGQDYNVTAAQEEIDDLLTEFYDDTRNLAELTSQQAISQKEIELQTDGNLFFVFFVNTLTGRVRVRSIPFAEVEDKVCNPDDSREPWFYLRRWVETTFAADGSQELTSREAYYPDWQYTPRARPAAFGGIPVAWDRPVYHVRVGGYGNWKFGLSEIYDAIDWATAYKAFLEDWASIVRAYRKFAFQLSTPGGKNALAAAKAKLGGPLGTTATDMPPAVGSTFISSPDVTLAARAHLRRHGSAEDGRRLLLMVAASFGFPETYFGDASVGSLATAKSLDRPTELAMIDRQSMWTAVLKAIHDYVLLWGVKAPQGPLKGLGRVVATVEDGQIAEVVEWNEGVDDQVAITFPPIVVEDVPALIGAITQAATLGASGTLAGTIDLVTLARLLLAALGVKDADEVLEKMFPDGEVPEPEVPEPVAPPAGDNMFGRGEQAGEAARMASSRWRLSRSNRPWRKR